ncbi:hypothetical protein, partial [Enterococcus sp. 3H8_DIV0648]
MNRSRLKKKVAIVLPIIFLLGTIIFLVVPRGILLRADDTVGSLVKVHQNNKDITDGSFQTEKSAVTVDVESDKAQLLVFNDTDKISISTKQDGVTIREVSEGEFDTAQLLDQIKKASNETEQSTESDEKPNIGTQKNELIQVFNPEGKTSAIYLKMIENSK